MSLMNPQGLHHVHSRPPPTLPPLAGPHFIAIDLLRWAWFGGSVKLQFSWALWDSKMDQGPYILKHIFRPAAVPVRVASFYYSLMEPKLMIKMTTVEATFFMTPTTFTINTVAATALAFASLAAALMLKYCQSSYGLFTYDDPCGFVRETKNSSIARVCSIWRSSVVRVGL